MNYQRVYDQIIERARKRELVGYYETHHVIPRALGGSDDPGNLVDLTYREHFLVHWLLTKIIVKGRGRMAMCYALQCMGTLHPSGQRIVSGWQYDVARRVLGGRNWRESRKVQWVTRENEVHISEHERKQRIDSEWEIIRKRAFEIAESRGQEIPNWRVVSVRRGKKTWNWIPVNLNNKEELVYYVNFGKSRRGMH
jgi:hypothetical protein